MSSALLLFNRSFFVGLIKLRTSEHFQIPFKAQGQFGPYWNLKHRIIRMSRQHQQHTKDSDAPMKSICDQPPMQNWRLHLHFMWITHRETWIRLHVAYGAAPNNDYAMRVSCIPFVLQVWLAHRFALLKKLFSFTLNYITPISYSSSTSLSVDQAYLFSRCLKQFNKTWDNQK